MNSLSTGGGGGAGGGGGGKKSKGDFDDYVSNSKVKLTDDLSIFNACYRDATEKNDTFDVHFSD